MKKFVLCSAVIATFISIASFANSPAGIGGGQGHENASFGSVTGGAIPPGLRNKGTPQGLQLQNKTPRGWSKGQKEGWDNKHHRKFKHKHKKNKHKRD